MKLAVALIRALRALATKPAVAAKMWFVTVVAFSMPVVFSTVLSEPMAAQAKTGATPGGGSTTGSGSTLVQSWVRTGSHKELVGLTLYRTVFEVRFEKYQVSTGVFSSTCEVSLTSFQKRVLGFWHDVTPSGTFGSGQFSGPRSPVDGKGGSGYNYSNPFTHVNMPAGRLIHFMDKSGPGFEMTHGKYSVTALTPKGSGITAELSW